jgi:predicted sulfurtransferase
LLDEPDVVLIDTRNDFELVIGSLDGALDPGTTKLPAENRWGGTCVIFNERKTIS